MNGDQPAALWSSLTSSLRLCPSRNRTRSASAPSSKRPFPASPKIFAGASEHISTISSSPILPLLTAAKRSRRCVSMPGRPAGGVLPGEGRGWGTCPLAKAWIRPRLIAVHIARRSSSGRSGGLQRTGTSSRGAVSRLRKRWLGVMSEVSGRVLYADSSSSASAAVETPKR